MKTSSLAYKINSGYVVLVALLLFIGLIAYVGVTRMLAGMQELNTGIETTRSSLEGTVSKMAVLEENINVLKKSEADFAKLADIQENLKISQQATAEVGHGLEGIESTLATQTGHLETINSSVEVLAKGISESAVDIRKIILAAEEINSRVLNSYIGFFNYLNEFVADVEGPLADISEITKNLKLITALLDKYKRTGQVPEAHFTKAQELITSIGQDLRRYRRFMQEIGETTSTTQISELKDQLVPYGNKIISSAHALRDVSRKIAADHEKKSIALVSATSSTAAQVLTDSRMAIKETEEHIQLSRESSKKIDEITTNLANALQGVSTSLAEVPEAVRYAGESMQDTRQSISLMEEAIQGAESSTREAQNIRLLMILGCIMAVVIGLGIGIYIYRRLVSPLSRFTEGLSLATANDLTVKIDSSGTTGELKDLIDGFNRLIVNFNDSVSGMKLLLKRVRANARNLDEVSTETFAAMDDQQKRTMQISQATEEMTSTTQSIAENSQEAEGKAKKVEELVQESNKVIEQMMVLSEEMTRDLELSGGRVKELAEDSEQINSIIEIIQTVASQTKLLALNAAVEAARAGKHGKGFAVVAEEVKKLAHETAMSITGIVEIINSIREKISPALKEIKDSNAKAVEHQAQSREIVVQLQEISHSTTDLTNQIEQIAEGTVQQSMSFPTIADSIETITGISQTTTQQMENIYRQVNELIRMSEELLENVDIYKINENRPFALTEQTGNLLE
jgi:methyl-accepting chemotaxis protein